jgi:cyclopropane fatty-acyl-phospholipid synthase-like methyltransferase
MFEDLIYSEEDILKMLDSLLRKRGGEWWDNFFSNRERPCPFFVEKPDESLVDYFETGKLKAGRVLELGCGNGRNSIYMALKGCQVDAADFSEKAITWANQIAAKKQVNVNFQCASIFTLTIKPHVYDIIYDCGCFHHLPPHRRKPYLELVANAIKPTGKFGLVCFRPEGGSGLSDFEVYEKRMLGGGLGYTEEQLRYIFSRSFNILECRKMKHYGDEDALFGQDFLWTLLMEPK